MHRSGLALAGAASLMLGAVFPAHASNVSFFMDPPDGRQGRVAIQPQSAPPVSQASYAAPEPASSDPSYYGAAVDPYAQPSMSPIPRETVAFDADYAPGTIVVSTEERRLYYVLPEHQALKYGIGVGRPGFAWSGVKTVTAKREWPDWTPPPDMLKRRPDLPRHMEGGIENPLGARAMYLGGTMYRIHGSNEPDTIGQAVSSGCIRMTNDDVADLYDRVKVGTKAIVIN